MKSSKIPVAQSSVTKKEKEIKKPLIIASLVIIVVVIASLFVISNTTKKISQGEISGIEKVVSKDVGQMFITGANENWWKFIADTSYDSKSLYKLSPFADNKGITRLGYAQYTNPDESIKSGGPLRVTYLETKDAESAESLAKWFTDKNSPASPYNVRTQGNIVAIGPEWAFDNSLYFSTTPIGLEKSYIDDTAASNRNANIGFSYMDTSKYFEGLLKSKDDADTKSLLNEYIKYEFGLKDKTGIWVGNAATYNSLWKGKFVKGGFEASILDPEKASNILQGRQKVISDNGEEMIVDPRESSLLNEVFVSAKNSSDASKASFKEFFTPYDSAFEKEGFSESSSLLRGAVDISEWNAALSGTGAKDENLSTIIFAGKDKEMAFTFIRNPKA